MAPGSTPEVVPPAAAQPQTYQELVDQIQDLTTRQSITVNDLPSPEAARALATGQTHDSLTILATQVRRLQARQAPRSTIALQLDALHTSLISQTHTNVPFVNETANFASEGLQGGARLGSRLVDTQANIGTFGRVQDGAVAVGLLGGVLYAGHKIMSWGKNLPGGIRHIFTLVKAAGVAALAMLAGKAAGSYVNMRTVSDETTLDSPDRRRANAAQLNTQNQATGDLQIANPRLNLRNVELTALTVPLRLQDGRILRFAANGAAVLVSRQAITPGTNALTESIQMQVDSIHIDSNGEYVIKQGPKTIYVPAANFYEAMRTAQLGRPTVLGGFSNPRAMVGRTADSIQVDWQNSPNTTPVPPPQL